MIYKYLYILLFVYISFEAFQEFFFVSITKHLYAKHKYAFLKEGIYHDYDLYLFRTKAVPFFTSLLNLKVLFAVIMFTVHHHFTLELLHKTGDFETEILFNTWTTYGIYMAGLIAGVHAYIKYKNTNNSKK